MPEWRIYQGNTLYCQTDWAPMAVAAWDRAARDTNNDDERREVVLERDGQLLERVLPRRAGHPWPDSSTTVPELGDVAAAILQLARAAGIDATALADQMTRRGLPTARSRLDRIRTISRDNSAHTSSAELMAMCYAAVGILRSNEKGD
jgi:hypothetical protein